MALNIPTEDVHCCLYNFFFTFLLVGILLKKHLATEFWNFLNNFSRNSEQNFPHIDKHRPCICISYIVCPPYLIKVDMCFDEP